LTAYLTNKRGNLNIDRSFRSVGRIKRSTGTRNKTLARQLDAMLTTLWQAGRVDILNAIKAGPKKGGLSILDVWSRYRVQELDRLPTVETLKPLASSLRHWLRTAKTGAHNKQGRASAVRAILALAPKDAGVQHLPEILRGYETGPSMFNRTRAAMLAFLRDTPGIGKRHKLHDMVADVRPMREARKAGARLTPDEVGLLAEKMLPYDREVWSLATTGMRTKSEYFDGQWTVEQTDAGSYVVKIHGTKTESAQRMVPHCWPVLPPQIGYEQFRRLMHKATGGKVRPYDLRGTYATWLEEVGIPLSRVKAYLGHSMRTPTDYYTRKDVREFLVSDAEKLRAYIGGSTPPARALKAI
jgi:integrase